MAGNNNGAQSENRRKNHEESSRTSCLRELFGQNDGIDENETFVIFEKGKEMTNNPETFFFFNYCIQMQTQIIPTRARDNKIILYFNKKYPKIYLLESYRFLDQLFF